MSLDASEWRKNPIAQIETTWIKREQGGGVWWRRALWALLLVSVVIAIASYNYARQRNFLLSPYARDMWWLRNAALILTVVVTLAHFLVLLRALHIAANGLTARSRTTIWDTLVLTGIDTRRLVMGKWRVVLQHTWRDFFMLAGLRVGVVLGLGVIVFNSTGSPSIVYVDSAQAVRPTLDLLLAVALILTFTMVNWLFTAAAGVTGSLLTRPMSSATFTAFSVRGQAIIMTVLLIFVPVMVILFTQPLQLGEDDTLYFATRLSAISTLNVLDNGTFSLAMLANPLDRDTTTLVGSAIFTLLLYVLMTGLLLWFAQRIARRQGINA